MVSRRPTPFLCSFCPPKSNESNLPGLELNHSLSALLVQNARTALLATDGGALLKRDTDRAVAARVPHDAAAAAVSVVVGGAGGEALGVGDLVLLAGRHFDLL